MKTLEIGQLELGQEVKVTFKGSGRVLEGKVIDFSKMQTQCWIENEIDIYHVVMHHAEVVLIEKEQEPVQEVKAPQEVKDLKTIKAEYTKELMYNYCHDVEEHWVAVFNSDEDGEEVWDCEFNTRLEDGELITIYFGTFYNEADAMNYAKDMRTKLKRKYAITKKAYVYTC